MGEGGGEGVEGVVEERAFVEEEVGEVGREGWEGMLEVLAKMKIGEGGERRGDWLVIFITQV